MKKVGLLILLITAFAVFTSAQSFAKMNGKDSQQLLQNYVIKSRLLNLLGKKSYADFMESWETINPVVKRGNFLFSSGCLIHACGHLESAIAIDLATKTIHVGIFREGEKTRFFNEKGRKTPTIIAAWSRNLRSNLKP